MSTDTATEAPTVRVGDFFYSSWGYDQTNVDFYRVVGLTPSGKSVRVVLCSSTEAVLVVGGVRIADPGHVVPGDLEDVVVQIHRLRIHVGCSPSFTVNSFAIAWLWDGTPKYRTPAGYGH